MSRIYLNKEETTNHEVRSGQGKKKRHYKRGIVSSNIWKKNFETFADNYFEFELLLYFNEYFRVVFFSELFNEVILNLF